MGFSYQQHCLNDQVSLFVPLLLLLYEIIEFNSIFSFRNKPFLRFLISDVFIALIGRKLKCIQTLQIGNQCVITKRHDESTVLFRTVFFLMKRTHFTFQNIERF